ncbi:Hypothetical predicted protein [Pelobates cultripes]|uniref:Uncharacterized protein n=1 Tax=Pelobates cultripes TaxID=61616 RepID=A0AAD1SWK2_PELCU|nr:Hypothetical predicted protein [Pelobates cultripes]
MTEANIFIIQSFILLALLCKCGAEFCPHPCVCKSIERKGIILNCSSSKLNAIPEIPANTIKLYLQNSSLTSVPAGSFDHLRHLQEVDLSGNPWNCDCNIFYVKIWLESQNVINMLNVRCVTPATLSGLPFQNLSGNEIQGCHTRWSIECEKFFVRDLYLIGFAVLLLIMMSYVFRMAKGLACRVTVSTSQGKHYKACTKDSHKSK